MSTVAMLPTLPDRAAGRRMLLLLVVALALPFVFAAGLIFSGWRPAATPHHGELLSSPQPLTFDELQIHGGPGKTELAGRWLLVDVEAGVCDASCSTRIDTLRRVHVALYKAMPRLKRVLLSADSLVTQTAQPDLTVATGWTELSSGYVYLVDAQGRAVLRYGATTFEPKAMLKDIDRLLRYSWSG